MATVAPSVATLALTWLRPNVADGILRCREQVPRPVERYSLRLAERQGFYIQETIASSGPVEDWA